MSSVPDQILEELLSTTGLDLSGYRRSTLDRRFSARLAKLGMGPEEYLNLFRRDACECHRLVDSLVVRVSSFFRDPIVFEIIAQSVLPGIVEHKRAEKRRDLRVWCAGCATGEEAHSVAILIHEVLKDEAAQWAPAIFATDVSEAALKVGETGIYQREQFEHTKLGLLDKYFVVRGSTFELMPSIRSMVHFSRDDLLATERVAPVGSVFGSFDLVLCRNVLIYLCQDIQTRVLLKLHKSMARDGYLVLGTSESLPKDLRSRFAAVDYGNRIFIKVS